MIIKDFFRSLKPDLSPDDDFFEELEEILVTADVGVRATETIIEELKNTVKEKHIKTAEDCRNALSAMLTEKMQPDGNAFDFENGNSVLLMVGVNGAGKTTTAGKLAASYTRAGKKVILAAADTFRAAATEQLTEWAGRAGCEIVTGTDGSDPGAVLYNACSFAKAKNADFLICDTAGRLQNKNNLMAELKKLYGIIDRQSDGSRRETLLVLDATTGQNALEQARQFHEAANVTGIVLTKMDGTAKGGIAVAIKEELGIPIKFIGHGERIEDLRRFDAGEYIRELFG